ncbi:hypothetical protein GGS23DRAFT_558942 [Durotheca rogersii]|uniref:uncharacterized protein n=1 Tax=Durotheca rogersii TaxID=419775 RepID=UPI00221ECC42|nr:uncharacterized protein GGS23DRAFT_558942 [Durotheca rogersii]KAI5865371.1 hypothetical protein GGS23DRAFT_558942 [Durotheca rogersii]
MEYAKYERLSSQDNSYARGKPSAESSISTKGFSLRQRLVRSAFSTTTLMSYCALSTTIIVFLTAAVLGHVRTDTSCQPRSRNGQSFYGVLGSDPSYMSLDHKYDSLWEDLGSTGLVIKLPDDDYGGEPRHASISMFHQLHCLSSLRHAIQQAREGIDPGFDWRDNDHWPHCMEYLRKTLLCWADDRIERRFVFENGTSSSFIDGSQDVRACGDSRRLIQLMRDHGKDVSTRPFP